MQIPTRRVAISTPVKACRTERPGARCVRRAFLCGVDAESGDSFEHRKAWVEERILELGARRTGLDAERERKVAGLDVGLVELRDLGEPRGLEGIVLIELRRAQAAFDASFIA